MSIFGRRLKEARLKAGLSQEQLGIEAELDPASASARMNRYELGKRVPNFELVDKIAVLLDLPVSYFYTTDEDMAQLLLKLHRLSKTKRQKVMQFVIEMSDKK
jgi:transcriptional regulator with XRE-family HTH domain